MTPLVWLSRGFLTSFPAACLSARRFLLPHFHVDISQLLVSDWAKASDRSGKSRGFCFPWIWRVLAQAVKAIERGRGAFQRARASEPWRTARVAAFMLFNDRGDTTNMRFPEIPMESKRSAAALDEWARREKMLDKTLADTYPASDPLSSVPNPLGLCEFDEGPVEDQPPGKAA
jgi:hypothetical protein